MEYEYIVKTPSEVDLTAYEDYARDKVCVAQFETDKRTKMWINEVKQEIWENSAYEEGKESRVIIMRAEKKKTVSGGADTETISAAGIMKQRKGGFYENNS